ncbi:recombinase family protein [Actinomadura sp. KC06]|nr:recombinase family protein [Actinomadura sp. KC06]
MGPHLPLSIWLTGSGWGSGLGNRWETDGRWIGKAASDCPARGEKLRRTGNSRVFSLLIRRGLHLRVESGLLSGIDLAADDPGTKMMVNVLASVPEFQRDMISENTRQGVAAAEASGKTLRAPPGQPPAMSIRTGRAEDQPAPAQLHQRRGPPCARRDVVMLQAHEFAPAERAVHPVELRGERPPLGRSSTCRGIRSRRGATTPRSTRRWRWVCSSSTLVFRVFCIGGFAPERSPKFGGPPPWRSPSSTSGTPSRNRATTAG